MMKLCEPHNFSRYQQLTLREGVEDMIVICVLIKVPIPNSLVL